jgi:tetratricopeptide (TPR) repeat protein
MLDGLSLFSYYGTHMTLSRGKVISVILALVIALVAVYGVWYFTAGEGQYFGLKKTMDVELDEATRTYLTQRKATTEAAIEAFKEKGEEVDLELYFSLYADAFALGDLVTAREALEKQLEGNPGHYAAWNAYGTVLEAMGDYDRARIAYKRAIDLGAGSEDFYRDYIELIRAHYPKEQEEILTILNLSLAEKGQTPWSMVELARYYRDNGDCQAAFDHYKVAISLAPSNEEIKNELAEARSSCK